MPRPFTTTTWNPDDKGPACVLSNNNLTATGDAYDGVRSRFGTNTGKWYFEVTSTTESVMIGIGAMPIAGPGNFATWPGAGMRELCYAGSNGWIYISGVSTQFTMGLALPPTGGTIGVYVDFDNRKIGFITPGGDTGYLHGGAAAFPASPTPYHAIAGGSTVGDTPDCTANFGGSAFVYSVPSGHQEGFGGEVDQLHSIRDTEAYNEQSMTAALKVGVGLRGEWNLYNQSDLYANLVNDQYLPTGWLGQQDALTGYLAGQDIDLGAGPAAESSLESVLGLEDQLQASVQSIATITADLDAANASGMAAASASGAFLTATLSVDVALASAMSAGSSISATFPAIVDLAAALESAVTVSATVVIPVELSTAAVSVASVSPSLAYRLRYFFGVSSSDTLAGAFKATYTQTISGRLEVSYGVEGLIRAYVGIASNIGRVDTRLQFPLSVVYACRSIASQAVSYAPRVQSLLSVSSYMTARAQTSFAVDYACRVTYSHPVSYAPRVQASVQASSALTAALKSSVGISYASRAISALQASYSARVLNSVGLASSLGFRVMASFLVPYSMSRAKSPLSVSYAMWSRALNSVKATSALVAQARSTFGATYSIRDFDRLLASMGFGYSLMSSGSISEATLPYLSINGKTVWLSSADVSCDEGGQVWEGTFVLLDPADAVGLVQDDEFMVDLGGDQYAFVLDSKGVSRSSPASVNVTIYGRSPLVKYSSPRAKPISKTWETEIAASEVAEELIPGVAWNILDWMIPPGVFGVERTTPYEALARLAQAAGGVVESLPNGLVVVRYKHPTPVAEYSDTTSALSISDAEDNYSYSDRYVSGDTVDLIAIGNTSSSSARDRVEVAFEEDPTFARLSVYPNVWRDNVTMYPTGPVDSMEYLGVETSQQTERVEFVAGAASLRFPVVSIDEVVWETNPLGSLNYVEYTSGVSCSAGSSGYSMASVKYTTKAHVFRVAGVMGTTVQFVFEE